MNSDMFGSVRGRPIEADGCPEGAPPLCSASREQLPGQGEQSSDVVRVTAADVLPSPSLRPPTVQTFDELEIPASFRLAAEKELTGDEKMLWLGRPSRNPQVHPRNLLLPMIGGGLIVLAVGIILVSSGNVFGFFFAGALGLIGLAFLLPLLVNPAKTCRFCYIVTNRRAILLETSLWQRGPVARSYLPQQLLGLERRDHPAVAGAGDLIFEYEFVIPGNTLNPLTGSFIQQNSTAGLSNTPQRVARGFMCLDQVREVENLIRTRLLLQLEQTLDAPKSAGSNGDALERPGQEVSVACVCGVTIKAPPTLAEKWVKCPRCAAAIALTPPEVDTGVATAPVSCREDGSVPADLKEKALAGLDPNEKPIWIGQPAPALVLARSSGFLAGGAVGILAAFTWLFVALESPATSNLLLPVGLFFVSAAVSSVGLLRWQFATRTCYALTNRRALVYKEGLFGSTRDSYSALELSSMRRSDSWLIEGSGDLIFRSVQVVSRTQTRPGVSSTRVKTIHYGFLAVARLGEVEKLVRETLIDPVVDRLTQAEAL